MKIRNLIPQFLRRKSVTTESRAYYGAGGMQHQEKDGPPIDGCSCVPCQKARIKPEKSTSKQQFKVGDRVVTHKFEDNFHGGTVLAYELGMGHFIDKEGVVTDILPNGNLYVHGWAWPPQAVTKVEPTYGEHMRSNQPIPPVGKFVPGELPNTEYVEKIFGGKLPVDSSELFGSDHLSFDKQATKSMNEYNRIYYEAAKTLTAKSDKVKLALKVYGFGSAAFFGRKTGLSTKEAGSVLSELKKKGIVEVKEKCACEDGLMVNSYALANKEWTLSPKP